MDKVKSFIAKPRNIYFSLMLLVTLVAGLFSISFSYYIDESSTEGLLKVKNIDNRIQSDDLVDGVVSLAPHETKTINLYVMSNNNRETKYKIYYKTDKNAKVLSDVELDETINANEVHQYTLMVSNLEDDPADVFIDIANAELDGEISFDGEPVEIAE